MGDDNGRSVNRSNITDHYPENICIFGDHDLNYVGQAAAYVLAKRLMLEAQRDKIERDVMVMMPDIAGFDWNDTIEKQVTMIIEGDCLCAS